jgi:hypothetical protein
MDTLLNNLLTNPMIFVAGALGGLLGVALSNKDLGKIIRMFRTPTSEIGALPLDEHVEIVGKADSEVTVNSPITKQTCILWQVEVSERRGSGKRSRWVTVYSDTSTKSFDVYDGTGKVQIHPSRLTELILRDDVRKSSGIFNSLDDGIQTALKDLGVETKGSLFNKNMRVHERYIEQGDQIYVLGKTFLRNGIKMMDGESSPLIVSDHSELRVLGTFFWRVVLNAILGIVIGIALYLYFTNR